MDQNWELIAAVALLLLGIGQLIGLGFLGAHPQNELSGVVSLIFGGYLLVRNN